MTAYPLKVERIHALDDDDDLGWYSKGHHPESEFREALSRREYRHLCEADESECHFSQTYWRKVPRGDGSQFYESVAGKPGAFPVTVLAVLDAKL